MNGELIGNLKEYDSVIIPIVSFVLGFLVCRFTMSKKERKDYEQKLFENGRELMEAQSSRFQEFSSRLQRYINSSGDPTLDDFFDIAATGEKYFYQLKISSDAILSGKVDAGTRDNTLVPHIREAVQKSLPTFYSVLQAIAKKKGIEYRGKLERANYESVYAVVEKYPNGRP